jgi:hypothetical protein
MPRDYSFAIYNFAQLLLRATDRQTLPNDQRPKRMN